METLGLSSRRCAHAHLIQNRLLIFTVKFLYPTIGHLKLAFFSHAVRSFAPVENNICTGPRLKPAVLLVETPSPQTAREPGNTVVDATLALDELLQRLGIRLVHRGVTHHPRPLAPGALVGRAMILVM